MADKPESRKTHITRICGTNRDGDRLDDIWVDLERADIIKSSTQIPPDRQWQGVQRKFRWGDDPDGEEYFRDGPPSRKTRNLKVCDPEQDDVDDPDEWVNVPVIVGKRGQGGAETMGQGFIARFHEDTDDDGLDSARVVEVRQIVHYDTNIDDAAQAAFDADPQRTNYVVPSEAYERQISSKDDGQGVDVEIVTYLKSKTNADKVMGLGRQTKLDNQYLIDQAEEADLGVIGAFGINPPYRLDIYQTIVNCQLSGLAVDFADGAYIQLAQTVPASKKVTISFWVRVPRASMAAATADTSNAPLSGIIPFITWGPPTNIYGVETSPTRTGEHTYSECTWHDDGVGEGCSGHWEIVSSDSDFGSIVWGLSGANNITASSYIGVDCASHDFPILAVNVVMPADSEASMEGGYSEPNSSVDGDTGILLGGGACAGAPTFHFSEICPGFDDAVADGDIPIGTNYTITGNWGTDVTEFVLGATPETFCTAGNANPDYDPPEFTPDHWHHVLISIDLSQGVSAHGGSKDISNTWSFDGCTYPDSDHSDPAPVDTLGSRTGGTAKFYIAIDDVNLTGNQLSAYFPPGLGDRNGVLSINGWNLGCGSSVNGTVVGPINFGRQETLIAAGQPEPSYAYSPAPMSFDDGLGVPAQSRYAGKIHEIEMAELQIALDVAIDTGNVANRRAFITKDGTPAPIKRAEELIGKKPEVIVHRSSNWIKGRNTGSLAVDGVVDGTAVGDITRYRPNPSLFGKQGT